MYKTKQGTVVTKVIEEYDNNILAQVVTGKGTYITLLLIDDIENYNRKDKDIE